MIFFGVVRDIGFFLLIKLCYILSVHNTFIISRLNSSPILPLLYFDDYSFFEFHYSMSSYLPIFIAYCLLSDFLHNPHDRNDLLMMNGVKLWRYFHSLSLKIYWIIMMNNYYLRLFDGKMVLLLVLLADDAEGVRILQNG